MDLDNPRFSSAGAIAIKKDNQLLLSSQSKEKIKKPASVPQANFIPPVDPAKLTSFFKVEQLCSKYSADDVILCQSVIKKTRIFFEGKREMFLFRDRSLAYLEHERNNDVPLFKAHITKMNIRKVELTKEGKTLCIDII